MQCRLRFGEVRWNCFYARLVAVNSEWFRSGAKAALGSLFLGSCSGCWFPSPIVGGVQGDLVVVDFCEANEVQFAIFAAVAEDSVDHGGVKCLLRADVSIRNPPTVNCNGVSVVAYGAFVLVELMCSPS